MAKTYEPRCYDLARDFLPMEATRAEKEELATEIQQTIENYLESRRLKRD